MRIDHLFRHLNFLPLVIGMLCSAASQFAFAGQFTVTPVRMFLTPQDRAIAVTITNEGDAPLVMQADLYSWKQKPGGEDDLVLTEDLILSPPVLKLAPKSRQVVRLARVKRVQSADQQTYRMIVREIPEALQTNSGLQLQVALAFSMPVFITPPTAKRQVSCVAERSAGNVVRAICENKGNAYAQLRELTLSSDTGEKLAASEAGGYILPDVKRGFDVKRAGARIPGGKARLTIVLDDGAIQNFDVTIPE